MVKKKNRRIRIGRQFIFLAAVLFSLFIAVGMLYMMTAASDSKHSLDNVAKPTLGPQITINHPTPTPPEGYIETKNFRTRQYDPKSMLIDYSEKIKYPQELINTSDSDLTPLYCTKIYWQDLFYANGFVTNEEGGPMYSLADERLLAYIKTLNNQYAPKHVILISACNTENGKTFVFYGISMGGGGDYWGKPYLGIDDGAGINEIIENIGSGGCSALQLARNEFLYIECSASEGGGGQHMISQINLSSKSTTRLLYCLTEGSKVTCKQ